MNGLINKGDKVFSRDGKKVGIATGSTHHCTLEGCRGLRIAVRWDDGKITFPCSRGMSFGKKSAKIL